MQKISIIVPSYNEEGNVAPLIQRIDRSMTEAGLSYEIIWVDDHSTDSTEEIVRGLESIYPIFFYKKQGQQGKAFSLLEGFEYAQGDVIAMIDADLQYPPESLVEMYQK